MSNINFFATYKSPSTQVFKPFPSPEKQHHSLKTNKLYVLPRILFTNALDRRQQCISFANSLNSAQQMSLLFC